MSKVHRFSNLFGVIVPFVATVYAGIWAWGGLLTWRELAIALGLYVSTALGVTIGFHRLLTHRSFQTYKPIELILATLGTMSLQGSVITWVADHRKHHAHTDVEGDPHSPHAGHEGGLLGMFRGLYHAHVGWLFSEHGRAQSRRYAPDLVEDPAMRVVDRAFPALALATFALPFVLGFAIGGSLSTGLAALLWAGAVRIFLLHHVTWSINSICHMFGTRRFATEDHSTNVFWLALPSLGEAWHHNHHAFPRAATHGMRWWELDPSGWVIRVMARMGLAWNVVRITPERQAARLAGAQPSGA